MNIRLWDMTAVGNQPLRTIEAGPVECWTISLSSDGKIVASGSQSGNINIWNTDTGVKEQLLPVATGKFIMSVAISPDQQLVACGASDGVVQVFDLANARRIHTLQGHSMAVRSLSFSPDSSTLVTASDDMHINQYDVRITGSGAGPSTNQITSFSGHASWVLSVAMSPDAKYVASGSSDRKVKIWDTASHQCIHTFSDHADQVWGVAWNTSGSKLVSASDDRSLVEYISQ